MVLENEVLAALPPRGLLRQYVLTASEVSDTHAVNHLAAGLQLLSVLVHPEQYMPWHARLRANVFTLMCAPSADRKGAALSFLRTLLIDAGYAHLVGKEPASEEALVDNVISQPQHIWFSDEFGNLLAQTAQGYKTPIKLRLNDLYDCAPISRSSVKKTREKQVDICHHPRVGLLGGVTPTYVEHFAQPHDFTGGVFSRIMWFLSTRERHQPLPNFIHHSAKYDALVAAVKAGLDNRHAPNGAVGLDPFGAPAQNAHIVGPCHGLSDAATMLYLPWANQAEALRKKNPEEAAMLARSHIHAIKAAFLIEHAQAPGDGSPWYIQPNTIVSGMAIADLHVKSVIALWKAVCTSKYQRERRAVFTALPEDHTARIRLGDVLFNSKLDRRTVLSILESLTEEGFVAGSGRYWSRTESRVTENNRIQVKKNGVWVEPTAPSPLEEKTEELYDGGLEDAVQAARMAADGSAATDPFAERPQLQLVRGDEPQDPFA